MDDTLKQYVISAVEAGKKNASDICDFLYNQSQDLIEQTIRWGIISEVIAPLVGLGIILTAIIIHFKYRKDKDNFYNEDCSTGPNGFLCNVVLFVVGLIVFFSQIMDVLYPLVAPKLYILEKISKLM